MTDAAASRVRDDATRRTVREWYSTVAAHGGCCTPSSASPSPGTSGCAGEGGCCGRSSAVAPCRTYTADDLVGVPDGADLGLGCGNPTALIELRPAQTVLDLGSGAGVDCFVAANHVGPRGRVIGVDMSPPMLTRARRNAHRGHYRNVEFRLGEIEHLPVADASVDVVISNCVVNLSPDKGAVYREAFRVLRPGGSLAISDMVATHRSPSRARTDRSEWAACSAGAISAGRVERLLREAGFRRVHVALSDRSGRPDPLPEPAPAAVVPARIQATKPSIGRRPAPRRPRRLARGRAGERPAAPP